MNEWTRHYTRYPVPVSCYGRQYLATSEEELIAVVDLLVRRKLALANRYRVGKSWPRRVTPPAGTEPR